MNQVKLQFWQDRYHTQWIYERGFTVEIDVIRPSTVVVLPSSKCDSTQSDLLVQSSLQAGPALTSQAVPVVVTGQLCDVTLIYPEMSGVEMMMKQTGHSRLPTTTRNPRTLGISLARWERETHFLLNTRPALSDHNEDIYLYGEKYFILYFVITRKI